MALMPAPSSLIHEILPVGMLQCNCHVVGDPKTHDAIVIDPGDDAEKILEILKHHHLKVSAIVITHAHIDHVIGLHRLQQATNAPVYMHADDLGLYRMLDVQASWLGWKTPKSVNVDQLLREGDAVRWGPFQAQVLHTPGHTQGSICLYLPSDMPKDRAAAVAAKSTERPPGRLSPAVRSGNGDDPHPARGFRRQRRDRWTGRRQCQGRRRRRLHRP
ncbi:MAG: MBL fold metallo-hydrolase, partial [Acidobacteriia bacterium]|nr:MBL fold metallo-hydrolase [Terriglobia bacterium]